MKKVGYLNKVAQRITLHEAKQCLERHGSMVRFKESLSEQELSTKIDDKLIDGLAFVNSVLDISQQASVDVETGDINVYCKEPLVFRGGVLAQENVSIDKLRKKP